MNKWFGTSWGAPVCDPADHADTPVGEACTWCGEPIAAGDNGMLTAFADTGGAALRPQHLDCFTRSLMGGFNHLTRRCQCYGGDLPPDPPGMTKRHAALLASGAAAVVVTLPPRSS